MKLGLDNLQSSTRFLFILLVLWGVVIVIQLGHVKTAKHVPLMYQTGQRFSPPEYMKRSSTNELSVRVDLLQKIAVPLGHTKDIFRLPPPPPPPKPVIAPPVVIVPPPPPPGPTPEELARRELGRFKLLGLATQAGVQEAMLVRGNEQFTVKPGEQVAGTIYVKEILEDAVILVDQPTGVSVKIP